MLALVLLSTAGCLLAVMVIIAMMLTYNKRLDVGDAERQSMMDDIKVAHAVAMDEFSKIMAQMKHVEDNSSFSGSKLALIEARLTNVERILVNAAPILEPMTKHTPIVTKDKAKDKTKDTGPFDPWRENFRRG
jgi:hypothetical protein